VRRSLQPDPRGKRPRRLLPSWRSLKTEQLLETLRSASAAAAEAEASLRDQVAALRARGVSWARIAEALGVSRQAAWERFS
jgi:hypothetical protein